MKGFKMAEKKEETKYIGRYGEVLKDVREIDRDEIYQKYHPYIIQLEDWHHPRRVMEAVGLDAEGKTAQVLFEVSKKSGRIDGEYIVLRPKCPDGSEYIESFNYKEGLLHGKEFHERQKGVFRSMGHVVQWRHGKKVNTTLDAADYIAQDSKTLRRLFSDASVKEAIKTGSLLKVKTAMTQAIKKQYERKIDTR